MKVRDLVSIVSSERPLWVENRNEISIDAGTPKYLKPETLELVVDLMYPTVIKALGGVNVICIMVDEVEDEKQK